jgi:salicylate hydroxylase
MAQRTAIVAGAGIGGLVAAMALHDSGWRVRVLEQARSLGPVGAGIQLSANGTRVLYQLGLGDDLERVTIKPGGKCIRLWSTGQEWRLFDLGGESVARFGYPYMMLFRPDLHQALVEGLCRRDPQALVLGARVVDVAQDEHAVRTTLADGAMVEANVLVGADGVHSAVRAKVIAEDQPRFSGCIAWRGVIPIEQLPASMQGPEGVNWVGPGRHVVHYPVNAGRLVSFTGIVEKQGWFRESWTETGSVEECHADFEGWHADIHALISQLPQPLRWAMMVREPLTNWTRGRVTLLGDAAHPTLPFLAQGAAMGIEDGCILARALQAHGEDVQSGLLAYQATRIERTTRIVLGSTANAQRFHNPELADAKGAAAYVAREWEEGRVRARYDWLFEYEPENVPLAAPAQAVRA